MQLRNIDLRNDAAAGTYLKRETVWVEFAAAAGELGSREGVNRYAQGDALIKGSDGDVWSVSRNRFDARYEPIAPLLHGDVGNYQNRPLPVLARQMSTAFEVERTAGGDVLRGKPGDWLLQYAPGDHGIVDRAKFARVYQGAGRELR